MLGGRVYLRLRRAPAAELPPDKASAGRGLRFGTGSPAAAEERPGSGSSRGRQRRGAGGGGGGSGGGSSGRGGAGRPPPRWGEARRGEALPPAEPVLPRQAAAAPQAPPRRRCPAGSTSFWQFLSGGAGGRACGAVRRWTGAGALSGGRSSSHRPPARGTMSRDPEEVNKLTESTYKVSTARGRGGCPPPPRLRRQTAATFALAGRHRRRPPLRRREGSGQPRRLTQTGRKLCSFGFFSLSLSWEWSRPPLCSALACNRPGGAAGVPAAGSAHPRAGTGRAAEPPPRDRAAPGAASPGPAGAALQRVAIAAACWGGKVVWRSWGLWSSAWTASSHGPEPKHGLTPRRVARPPPRPLPRPAGYPRRCPEGWGYAGPGR